MSIVFLKKLKNFYFFLPKLLLGVTFAPSRGNYKEFPLTFGFLFSKMRMQHDKKVIERNRNSMEYEYETDLITLVDDEGQEHEFEVLDTLETDEGVFMALVPTRQNPEEVSEEAETYYIFEVIEEDGEEQLQEVEDDELLDRLADTFEARFNEAYYEDEDE